MNEEIKVLPASCKECGMTEPFGKHIMCKMTGDLMNESEFETSILKNCPKKPPRKRGQHS